MLTNLRPDEIENIIKLAEAIETKHPRQRRNFGVSKLESPDDPPDLKELKAALEAISPPARMEMLALIWVARGDYRLDAFEESSGVPPAGPVSSVHRRFWRPMSWLGPATTGLANLPV